MEVIVNTLSILGGMVLAAIVLSLAFLVAILLSVGKNKKTSEEEDNAKGVQDAPSQGRWERLKKAGGSTPQGVYALGVFVVAVIIGLLWSIQTALAFTAIVLTVLSIFMLPSSWKRAAACFGFAALFGLLSMDGFWAYSTAVINAANEAAEKVATRAKVPTPPYDAKLLDERFVEVGASCEIFTITTGTCMRFAPSSQLRTLALGMSRSNSPLVKVCSTTGELVHAIQRTYHESSWKCKP